MPSIKINGETREFSGDPDMPLLWFIRDDLNLTGTKFGCGGGFCGACTVIIDGKATRSCITPLASASGKDITTIEHVATTPTGKSVSEAWVSLDVPQCGYCQAGQVMSATALLSDKPKPSDDEIDAAMAGNLCRCCCYLRVRAAIKVAAGISAGEHA